MYYAKSSNATLILNKMSEAVHYKAEGLSSISYAFVPPYLKTWTLVMGVGDG
jgi:hypothetical protein